MKTFVLDTCVLLYDPNSIKAFDDNKVVIPIYVIEEVDKFKTELSELGRNARQVARLLDGLREEGNLVDGVPIGTGILQVKSAKQPLPEEFISVDRGADSKILAVALETNESEDGPVVFVTKDLNLRIRGASLGLTAVDFISDINRTSDEVYTGVHEVIVDGNTIDELFLNKKVSMPSIQAEENSFGVLTNDANKSALVRFYPSDDQMRLIHAHHAWGIHARNKEQQFALELLMDDSIQLVTITGKSGVGKTLIALAAGLQKVADEKKYQKLFVSRPVMPLGKDIGFLPGDLQEKLRPWMQPIYDNLEFLMGISEEEKKRGRGPDELFDMGFIKVEPLTYIRGRSIPNQFILIDEAQNLTLHEIKTIITRCGEETKIILTGDPDQIDNPYLDSMSNGLVHVVNQFKGHKIAGHITLTKGERSGLAEIAAQIL